MTCHRSGVWLDEKCNYSCSLYVIELLNTQTIYSRKINDHKLCTRFCPFHLHVQLYMSREVKSCFLANMAILAFVFSKLAAYRLASMLGHMAKEKL